jgi:hypothetical protein
MDPHAQHMHMAMTSIRWFVELNIEASIDASAWQSQLQWEAAQEIRNTCKLSRFLAHLQLCPGST